MAKNANGVVACVVVLLSLCLGSAAMAGSAPVVFKLASTSSPEMYTIKAFMAMAEDIKKSTNGQVELQVYPSSQLGDQRDYLEGISLGTVEMCLIATSALESFDKRYALFGKICRHF